MLKEKKDGLREFGQKLFSLRKKAKLTQMQLADKLDVDFRQISRYETGEAEMGVVLYQKMLTVFGVSGLDEPPQADKVHLLQLWDGLSPENKKQLISLAAMMNKAQKSDL